MSRAFKRLFEVQILHDYFLTTVDGTSFFERNEEEKEDLLTKKLEHNIYDISDLFVIQPLEDTKLRMQEYNMMISITSLGFIIGIEVKEEDLAGAQVYKPQLEIPNTIKLNFSIRPRVSFFKTITTMSFTSGFPAIYYFTNKGRQELDEVTVPVYKTLQLTDKFKSHQPGMQYEMGALIDFAGTLREAIQQTDGSDPNHWVDIPDRGFVSDADRILLPNNFTYVIKKEEAVTQISFVLEDESNTEIKTITRNGSEVIENVALNFSKVDETDEASDDIPSGFYTLKITANAEPEITYSIYLNTAIFDKNQLGVIDIRFDEPDSPYSLLDAGGFLKTRITAADVKIPHPVFEIRFKNRRTYWRYNSESTFTPGEIASTNEYLVPESLENEKLVSIDPKALTETLVPFNTGTTLILPHPKAPSLRVEKEKIFSEIFINPSNRLLNN